MVEYKYDEELWYDKQKVLYHHKHNDLYSIVYFIAPKKELAKWRAHPNHFTDIGREVYLRVLNHKLSSFAPVYTNREAVFLLTKEE